MKTYVKPMALVNNELAEGVYMASGVTGSDCYSNISAVVQRQESASIYICVVEAKHNGHITHGQKIHLSFSVPVTVTECEYPATGNGTQSICLNCTRYNNENSDNFYLSFKVQADTTPAITSCSFECNGN